MPWPMAVLPVWHPRYTDDTSTKGTEFCSLTGDSYPKMIAYNTSLELPALASSNTQVKVQDPSVCL